MTEDKKSVRVEVTPENHQKWKDFVENSDNYSSLSSLVRTGVRREIKHAESDRKPQDAEVEVDLTPVEEALYDLKERMGDVEQEVRGINLATEAQGDERVEDLMHYVRECIPLVESEDELRSIDAEVSLPALEQSQVTGEVGDVMDAIRLKAEEEDGENDEWLGDVSKWDVERALERLARSVERIHVMSDGNVRRFYEVKR